jgi:hypothetical protein
MKFYKDNFHRKQNNNMAVAQDLWASLFAGLIAITNGPLILNSVWQ